MMLRKTEAVSSILAAFLAAHVVFSSPLPESSSGRDTNVQSTNETDMLEATTDDVDMKHQSVQDEKPKVEDCTLKALGILLSNQEDTLSEGCKIILSSLIQKSSGRQTHLETPEEVNLQRELNDLAKKNREYEALSQQIQNAQNLLAEKRLAEGDDADTSEPEPSRLAKFTNDDLVDVSSDNFRSTPLLRRNNNFPHPYDYKQRYFENGREMVDRSGPEGFWNPDFSDDTKIDQFTMPNDKNDAPDDDYLVIPLRFLRKNMMLRQQQPIGTDFLGNDKVNLSPPVTTPRKWYGDKNEMVNWLLRSLMSSKGRKGAESPDVNEDSQGFGESTNNVENQAKRESMQNLDAYDDNNEKAQRGPTTLDRNILSQVEDDIKKLRKDLLRLQVGHTA